MMAIDSEAGHFGSDSDVIVWSIDNEQWAVLVYGMDWAASIDDFAIWLHICYNIFMRVNLIDLFVDILFSIFDFKLY